MKVHADHYVATNERKGVALAEAVGRDPIQVLIHPVEREIMNITTITTETPLKTELFTTQLENNIRIARKKLFKLGKSRLVILGGLWQMIILWNGSQFFVTRFCRLSNLLTYKIQIVIHFAFLRIYR